MLVDYWASGGPPRPAPTLPSRSKTPRRGARQGRHRSRTSLQRAAFRSGSIPTIMAFRTRCCSIGRRAAAGSIESLGAAAQGPTRWEPGEATTCNGRAQRFRTARRPASPYAARRKSSPPYSFNGEVGPRRNTSAPREADTNRPEWRSLWHRCHGAAQQRFRSATTTRCGGGRDRRGSRFSADHKSAVPGRRELDSAHLTRCVPMESLDDHRTPRRLTSR